MSSALLSRAGLGLAALGLAVLFTPPVQALDKPAPGAFPHEMFNTVLQKYVDTKGLVDYKGISLDRATLDSYVAYVALVSPAEHPDVFPALGDKLAYYINAYNALAITGVIDRPGLISVQDSKLGFFLGTKYKLGGDKMNLYNLENQAIRPTFNDPRLHFALNCQSGGCPRLPQTAYMPATVDAELTAGSKEFCTSPTKVYADSAGVWHISQIFEWYKGDFEAAGGAVAFINANGGTIPETAKVETIPYDWSLSTQVGKGP